MNLRPFLFGCVGLLVPMIAANGEAPAANVPPGPARTAAATEPQPSTPAPPQAKTRSAAGAQAPTGTNGKTAQGKAVTKAPNTPALPNSAAATPTASAKKPTSMLDNYLAELNEALKLSPEEKTDIQSYYLADGAALKSILNGDSLSPQDQAQKVADLRDSRNEKIEALLHDGDRQREFYQVEAKYRVALTEFAADGGLASAQPPAP
jgi:hypothetical protein